MERGARTNWSVRVACVRERVPVSVRSSVRTGLCSIKGTRRQAAGCGGCEWQNLHSLIKPSCPN